MTRAMTVRSDHRRTDISRRFVAGRRRNSGHHRSGRHVSPSTSTVCSRPIAPDPGPYRTGSTCVSASGWNELVMATPSVKSASRRSDRAPRIDSEFVRVSAPSRSDTFGSTPRAFIACSSRWVPSAPAASTTWSAVKVRCRVCTVHPGRMPVTACRSNTCTPSFSARYR